MGIFTLAAVQILVLFWRDILCSCKSSEPLFIHVYPERANTGYRNVDSQVRFKPIYEEWVRNVVTSNQRNILFRSQVTEFIRDNYSFSLRTRAWLDDPPLIGILFHGLPEQVPILRKHERGWKKVKISNTVNLLASLDAPN